MGSYFSDANDSKNKTYFLNHNIISHLKYKFYVHRRKYPLILEDYFGMDMRYKLLSKAIGNLFVNFFWFRLQFDARNLIIEGDSEILIDSFLKTDEIRVDDIIEINSGHRPIHMAVLFDDDLLIDYLIQNEAHLMARDYNGYTPLLKAAALGRLSIVKKLVEAGVPPNHKDPWGVTPLDKAMLYNHVDVIEYLNNLEKDKNRERVEYWKTKKLNEKFRLTVWYMKQF